MEKRRLCRPVREEFDVETFVDNLVKDTEASGDTPATEAKEAAVARIGRLK